MSLYKNKNWLHQKYVIEELSPNEISKLANCSRGTIGNWLVKHQISKRTMSEAVTLVAPHKSRKYPKLNDEQWLRQKYLKEGVSAVKIGEIIGVKTSNSVRQSLIRFGIPLRNSSDAQTHNRESDGLVLNLPVIEGCLLGDGSLSVYNKNSAICKASFQKKNIHYDHVMFVANQIFNKNPEDRIKKSGNKVNGKFYSYFCLSSYKHKSLRDLYNRWYPDWNNQKKIIPEDLSVSAEMLLHMFLDDGSSHHRRKESKTKQIAITLSTQCFEKENQEIFVDKVKSKFGLQMSVKTTGDGTGWRIQVPQSQTPLFYEIIGPPPVESLAYKWK